MDEYPVPEPLVFNPLKHYLRYIRNFVNLNIRACSGSEWDSKKLIKELKHTGTSVMDIYTGTMSLDQIFDEVNDYLITRHLLKKDSFASWAGINPNNFKITSLSDGSQWTLKYRENEKRYVHIFPARLSPYTFRVKANTLKSAILYLIIIGKDYITEDDLNRARALTGLSPVKDVTETEAVTEMIDILRI